MLSRTTALVLAVSVSGTSAVSYGQDSPARTAELKKDEAELKTYTLTMDIVNRTLVTVGAIRDAVKSDPALQKSSKDKSDANQEDEQRTISQMASAYSSSPKLVAIAAAHGFTPRKFALSQMSIVQAGLAVAALQAGASMSDVAKSGVNPDNVKLFRDHKAELDELFKKYPIADPN